MSFVLNVVLGFSLLVTVGLFAATLLTAFNER